MLIMLSLRYQSDVYFVYCYLKLLLSNHSVAMFESIAAMVAPIVESDTWFS